MGTNLTLKSNNYYSLELSFPHPIVSISSLYSISHETIL